MKKQLTRLLSTVFLSTIALAGSAQNYYSQYTLCPKRIIAYFASWGDRPDKGNYGVDDIPWNKLTHINYAFAGVGKNYKISLLDSAAAISSILPGQNNSLPYKGQFNLFTVYKAQYPHVKTLISVGGWAASGGYYEMAANATRREIFANSCISFLKQYGFDGIDLDWEYPTSAPGAILPCDEKMYYAAHSSTVYSNYNQLLKRLRQKLDSINLSDNKKYLLTIAAPASGWTLSGMELGEHCKYLDYLNIMSYDLHGAWNGYVGPHNALYASSSDPETSAMDQPTLNCDWAVKYYSGIIHPSRINLGIGYYSRGWDNVSGGTNGLWGSTGTSSHPFTCEGGQSGSYTIGDGAAGIDGIWNDPAPEPDAGANPIWHILNLLSNPGTATYNYLQGTPLSGSQSGLSGYSRYFDNTTKSVWLWNNSKKTFLTYEDTASLHHKLDYIVSRGLGGMMFWELSGDYHYNAQLGYYTTGHDLTDYARNYFNQATLVHAQGRTLPAASGNFSYSFSGSYSHPNYTPHFYIRNRSNVAVPGGWTVEFDLPKSARWDGTWGTGTLSVIDNTHPLWTRYRVVGPSWSSINPNDSVDITGAIKLDFSRGPLNVVFQGSTSIYEYKILPDTACTYINGIHSSNESMSSFSIYPNPSNDIFYFSTPLSSATLASIYDVKGCLVYRQQLQSGETALKLNYLPDGLYIVQLQQDKGTQVQRLLISH